MTIIFHIDLNAFFASAEITKHPEYKGKPLVVCKQSRKSIITTATYEARHYGVTSAMPLFKAKELCPHLIVVEPHFELYKSLSNQFFALISQYSSVLEVASIDECYVDVSEYILKHKCSPSYLASLIQKDVEQSLNLQCSIGISYNKFLAKMASDMKKPMGITTITRTNLKELIWPLPIKDMIGIGKKTSIKLEEKGILTIGDLAKYPSLDELKSILGIHALLFKKKAQGEDFGKVNPDKNDLKSIGNSHTFEFDSRDETFLKNELRKLSQEVAQRAIRRDVVSNQISISIKDQYYKTTSKQMIIEDYTNEFETIYSYALILFDTLYQGESLRLVGVSLNHVKSKKSVYQQLSLFKQNHNEECSQNQIDQVIFTMNAKLGDKVLMKASDLPQESRTIQSKYLIDEE